MRNISKIICILLSVLFLAGCEKQEEGLLISEKGASLDAGAQDGVSDGSFTEQDGTDGEAAAKYNGTGTDGEDHPESGMVYVQVSGAVNKPGVYALPQGSRIFQAVELAGGVTEEADVHSLNQAKSVTDGEMIWVMTAAEAAEKGNPSGEDGKEQAFWDDGKVNLNTATKEELMGLPGIGAAKADSILAWRKDNGSFTQIEDLMKIEGIKEGVFSKIEDYVKVQ